jgi:hypothetical protein
MTFLIGCYCSLLSFHCQYFFNRLLLHIIWYILFFSHCYVIFAVIMQHTNKTTSDLKKSGIAHNSMEELRMRLWISSVASSTFFAHSDESSTAEVPRSLGPMPFMLNPMIVVVPRVVVQRSRALILAMLDPMTVVVLRVVVPRSTALILAMLNPMMVVVPRKSEKG